MAHLSIISVAAILLITVPLWTSSKELPSYIPTCRRNDPDLNACILNATKVMQPFLKDGIAELGIPAVEPLIIPMVRLEQGTQAVNYKATLSDIKIRGLGKYKFTELQADLKNFHIKGKLDIGEVSLVCDYVIMGRALLLPIRGNGLLTANFTNAMAGIDMQGMLIKRKGLEYYQNHETEVKVQIGTAKAQFDNLFDGDETLTKVTNEFLNMHAKDIVDEVKPAVETVIAMIVDDIANKVFQSVPFEKLFPSD